MVRWRGGRSIYIPQEITAERELVKHVGWKAATWLVHYASTAPITKRKGDAYKRALRDHDILAHHQEGVPVARLARPRPARAPSLARLPRRQ